MTDPAHAGYVQVQTTTDSRELAAQLARSAVESRLAACGQVVGPIRSTYWWRDQVEQADEWLVLLKTRYEKFGALADHIRGTHPYETPEIIATPIVAGSTDYLHWIGAQTTRRAEN